MFTQFNTELGIRLVDVFDANIYSLSSSEVWDDGGRVEGVGEYQNDIGFVRLGAEERARFMHYLVGGDESAARLEESIDVYQQYETAIFLQEGRPEENARGLGILQGLLDEAFLRDKQDRESDLGHQVDREEAIAEFVVSEAAALSEKIPRIGFAVSKGLELGQDGIVGAIVDGDYEVTPRGATYSSEIDRERYFRLEALEFSANGDPVVFNYSDANKEMRELMEAGVVSISRGGEELGLEDVGEDFVFDSDLDISVEKDPSEWNEGFRSDGGKWSVDASMGIVLDDLPFTVGGEDGEEGETFSGGTLSEQFGDQFTMAYNDVERFFDPEEDGSGQEE